MVGVVNLVTVTVTEALVLRPLLEDRGLITGSIHILVPVDRMKQKCSVIFQYFDVSLFYADENCFTVSCAPLNVYLLCLLLCAWQYFSPYLSADMRKMAEAFNTTVSALEEELMQLILDGKISARIDSHNKA